ncbi:MAG: hypothetical protein ACJ74U_14175 [Jatrophihabitantaceae bacterium]
MGETILLPMPHFASVVGHVVRKLTGFYLEGETPERKAFGMLAGVCGPNGYAVTAVFPLLINLRADEQYRQDMDDLVDGYAIPSETPNAQRGWIASPAELMAIEEICDAHGWLAFGNYHTHRVPWDHDPVRDTCTRLDRTLAADSGQWTFIVSAVDLHRPSIRAFYEGDNNREATIRFAPEFASTHPGREVCR